MNISFTERQEKYIADQLASGDYQNASEVVRDTLRLHEYYRRRMLEDLREEIAAGWDGPETTASIQDIVASRSGLKNERYRKSLSACDDIRYPRCSCVTWQHGYS